jgi:hypothetical protein
MKADAFVRRENYGKVSTMRWKLWISIELKISATNDNNADLLGKENASVT